MYRIRNIALHCVLLTALFACQPTIDREQTINEVEKAISANQFSNAEIKLKSLLSINPEDSQARQLLGAVLLEQGNFEGAIKELERAIALGINGSEIRLQLLQAQLRAGEYDKVLSFNPRSLELSPASLSEAYVLKGIAALQSNLVDDAKTYLNDAIDTATDSQFAYLGRAYIASTDDDWESALNAIEESIRVNPDFAEAYLMKGQVFSQLNQLEKSLDAYQKYFQLKPQSHEAKLIYVNSLMQNNQFEQAKPLINELAQTFGKHPVISQLKGVMAYIEGNYEQAKRHTDDALQNGLRTPVGLSINGISAYELGLYEQAYRSLKSAAPDLPEDHPARKLLFVTQMQLGFEQEAVETFSETNFDSADATILSMTGLSLANSGQTQSAEEALSILQSFDDLSSEDLTRQGMLRLQLNDLRGIEDLKSALASTPALQSAQVALFDAYLRSEDYEALLAFANEVIANEPESILGYNMLASAQLGLNDEAAARQTYQKALSLDPINPASLNFLADKEAKKENYLAAANILKPLVMERPGYMHGLLMYYQYLLDAGKPDEALRAVERANDIVQDSVEHKFLLASIYYARSMFPASQTALLGIAQNQELPNNYWLLLIETHLKLDQWENAQDMLREWTEITPFNEFAHINRVAFLKSRSMNDEARQALSAALAAIPRSNTLKLMGVQLEIEAGNIAIAQSKLKEITVTPENQSAYEGIEAFFDLLRNRSDDNTLQKLLTLYEKHPTKFAVNGIISAYQQRRDKVNMVAFLRQRVENFPRDYFSRKMLADALFLSEPFSAIEQYQLLNKVNPQDLMVTNNLAWLLYENGQMEEAHKLINEGLAIRSDVPFLLDTAAFIEKARGNTQRSLDLFALAYQISPTAGIALHYATALVDAGRKDEAKEILEQIPDSLEQSLIQQRDRLLQRLE